MSDLIPATDTDDALTKQLRQLQTNVDEIRGRVLWLERKLAELLDGVCVVMGLAAGWVVADVLVGGVSGIIPGIIWLVCLLGTYVVVTLILKRAVLKGAPDHVETPQ
jgi:tetrahydromethanopterin S-methyltransferase subunit F